MKKYNIKFGDNKMLAREWGQNPFTVIDGYFEYETDAAGGARWVTIFAREEIAYYLSHRTAVLEIDDEFIDPVTGLDWFPVFVHQKNTEGIVCQFFDSEGQADHTDPVRIKR